MTVHRGERVPVLIVVSRDFGELSNAMKFARSPGLLVTLLLPTQLSATVDGLDEFQVVSYSHLEDVESAVESVRPEVVLLFSGYLYVIGRLFKLEPYERWIGSLHKRRLLVMTSDPFLNTLQKGGQSFDANHPGAAWSHRHFERIARAVEGLDHVYAAPRAAIDHARNFSYGLPVATLRDAQVLSRTHRLKTLRPGLSDDGFWLYVLSEEDWGVQSRVTGKNEFAHLLRSRMGDAVAARRVPILVGPRACVEAVAAESDADIGLMLPFCNPQLFEDLTIGAEHVFYWNQVSNSILLRAINALPVWFFDKGHLLRMTPGVEDLVKAVYFGGTAIEQLDMAQVLDAQSLCTRANASRAARTALAMRYVVLSSPTDMIMRALSRRALSDPLYTVNTPHS